MGHNDGELKMDREILGKCVKRFNESLGLTSSEIVKMQKQKRKRPREKPTTHLDPERDALPDIDLIDLFRDNGSA